MRWTIRATFALGILLATATFAPAARGTGAPSDSAATRPRADLGFGVERIGRDLYAVIRQNPPGFLFDCNSAFIIGDKGVAVVDCEFTVRSANEVIAALRKITKKPVLDVVITHAHDDHVSGAQAWRAAFPTARFVAHEATARDLSSGYLERRGQLAGNLPGGIEYLSKVLADGRGSDGEPLTREQLVELDNDIRLGRQYVAEAPDFRLVVPDRTFRDSLALDLGGRKVVLRFLGRAHTAGDIEVEVPDAGVIFSGDLVVWPVPLAGTTSYPLEYGATLDALLERPHSILVPGHGPVMRDDAYLRLMSRLMHALADQTRAAVARGDSLGAARRNVDLEEFRRAICGDSKLRNRLFDGYVVQPGIARAFEQASANR